jgi:L-amino acid N-acyltransferase YncA
MNKELYFLRSSEQYVAKQLLTYVVGLDQTGDELSNHPYLEQYEREFGSFSGDVGVYMVVDNKLAGGAWVRILKNGFAFIDFDTPELVIALKPEFRNQGIGTEIMNQLFIEVSKIFSQVCISVVNGNKSISFFENLGFKKVENSDYENGAGGVSFKMLKILDELKEQKEEKHLEEECFKKSFRQTN